MNKKQLNAATNAMINWLSHPRVLGKAPAEIECTTTFELDGMKYYVFRYRPTAGDDWLLGVAGGYLDDELEHWGHVFSEMKPYDESTAVADAMNLVELVCASMDEGANEEPDMDDMGTFVGFALLSDNSWNKGKLIDDLKEMWNIDVVEEEDSIESAESLTFLIGGMIASFTLIPGPIPDGEAVEVARNNYMWDEAVAVTETHKAHLMVALLGNEEDAITKGMLFTKLMSACCKQEHVLGIYTSVAVFEPNMYNDFAALMKEGLLPIYNWIWFGLYTTDKGLGAYTYGMYLFGKDEMEVLYAEGDPDDVRDILFNMVSYVLEQEVTLNDGETIGFSETDKHTIIRSQGVAFPDRQTLKISY